MVVMKNWDPLLEGKRDEIQYIVIWLVGWLVGRSDGGGLVTYVLGPALAIERRPGFVCFSLKFSSANFSP